ncbi:MAG: 2-dehydro-3-deoxyphosphogluconate aldolase/(4S)-4-hydroxy-2-oxoglutarate aldolase, partial [Limisphaerales bacterium]
MINQLSALKIIPVVALDSADDAEPLADALVAGGLPVAEITLRTDAAL